ncbi:MAG: hypothetical protein H6817_07945 [Phycisphaerales bacterium]|nr:hypothetical protein [Phycisphaerales bacterium]
MNPLLELPRFLTPIVEIMDFTVTLAPCSFTLKPRIADCLRMTNRHAPRPAACFDTIARPVGIPESRAIGLRVAI